MADTKISALPSATIQSGDQFPFVRAGVTSRASLIAHKIDATVDPTSGDDSDDGYGVGSTWTNVTGDESFICVDATVAAAVWLRITDENLLNNYAATTAPTTGDDSGDGYAVGSMWIDTTGDAAYICVDATAANAVWLEIGGGGSGWTYGTWTPTLDAGGVAFTSVTYDANRYGRYAYTAFGDGKIFVIVEGYMITDAITVGSASGLLYIGSLPFTVADDDVNGSWVGYVGMTGVGSFTTLNPVRATFSKNATNIALYGRSTLNGSDSTLTVSNAATGANSNKMVFGGTYIGDAP